MVKALGLLHKKGLEIHTLFIGNDDDENNSNLSEIISLAKRLGIENNLSFAGFRTSPFENVLADFLVLPSKHEGFGLVLAESIARGLPVIVSDSSEGFREIVNEENGIFYKSRDFNDLANKIEFLNLNRNLFYNQEKIRGTVINKFSEEAFFRRLKNVFLLSFK